MIFNFFLAFFILFFVISDYSSGDRMTCIEIKPNIYWNGLNDRTTDLFEGIWPISKEGVSYNSYVIVDEKIALIDLVKGIKTDDFLNQIEEVVRNG